MPESKIGPANVPANQESETHSFKYTVKDLNNQGKSDNVMISNSDKSEKLHMYFFRSKLNSLISSPHPAVLQ